MNSDLRPYLFEALEEWAGGVGLKDAVWRRYPAVKGGGFAAREFNMEAERLGWGP